MSALTDLVKKIETEAATAKRAETTAKNVLVEIAQAINKGLRALSNGVAHVIVSPASMDLMVEGAKRRARKRPRNSRGMHPTWRGRVGGQYTREDGMKGCPNCGKYKLATADYFQANSTAPSGLQSWCRACTDVSSEQAAKRRVPNINGSPAEPLGTIHRKYYRRRSHVVRRHSLDPRTS